MQGTNKQRRNLGNGYILYTADAPDGTRLATIGTAGFYGMPGRALWSGSFDALKAAVTAVARERKPEPR